MKPKSILLLALCGLSLLASCKQQDTPGGDPSTPTEPQNIREVSQLLRSAGYVPEAAEPRLQETPKGQPTSTFAPRHYMEHAMKTEDCDRVVQPMQYDFADNSEDFAILDPWPSVLWPGCLIQGKSIRGKNVPTVIPLISKRQPGRINLQIVSGAKSVGDDGEGLWYEEVPEMRESNVIQAQNSLIRRWQESGVPASTSYTMEVVNSAEEAIIATGLDINKSWGKVHAFFGTGFDKRKNHVLVKLYQRFYTLSYEDPDGGFKGVFKPTIQQSDLEPYTGPGNPICYISSVSYGRVYYLLFETTASASALRGELSTTFSSITAGATVQTGKAMSESRVKMIQRGGDALSGLEAAMDAKKVVDFIREGAKPSPTNVGTPISFTVKHLYDAQPVRMSNTLTYSYDKVTFVPRSKRNNVAIFLKDVKVETLANGKWEPSNRGQIELLDATVRYSHLQKSTQPEYQDFFPGLTEKPDGGLRNVAYLPVHRGVSDNCYFGEGENVKNQVTLFLKLRITSSAYRTGSRSHKDPQIVELSRTYHCEGRTWRPLEDGAGTHGDPFRTLMTERRIGELTFNVRADFSFFVDNILILSESQDKK